MTVSNFVAHDSYKLTAREVYSLIVKGDLTVEAYAKSLLSRINARDNAVKAWAYLDPIAVLEQAKILDAIPHEERGPLHGVAIGVKDIMLTKGNYDMWINLLLLRTLRTVSRRTDHLRNTSVIVKFLSWLTLIQNLLRNTILLYIPLLLLSLSMPGRSSLSERLELYLLARPRPPNSPQPLRADRVRTLTTQPARQADRLQDQLQR
jgi:hypothetical protein